MVEAFPYPIICIVAERQAENGEIEILLQRRTKARANRTYYGFWELPQGKLRAGESLYAAVSRELQEETGLTLVELEPNTKFRSERILESNIESFHPTLCVIDLNHDYIGWAVIVHTIGTPRDNPEASDHRWVNQLDAYSLIKNEKIFPLNVAIIRAFFGKRE